MGARMQLRPYQEEARQAVLGEWGKGNRRTLLVLCTGTGKTVIFSKVIEDAVRAGKRALVLAHRGELLDQAADKLEAATGLRCAREQAGETCLGSWYRVAVGSVQTLMGEARLSRFPPDFFGVVVVDEAHHILADSYMRILGHFGGADVLGVTATPDRGDMKDLGKYFDSLAYEYALPRAIQEGYLCRIAAQTIPLRLDISGVGTAQGDFKAGDLGTALDPYLERIAREMARYCAGRKTVVFLPLVRTSQKFRDVLNAAGFRAAEANGESRDRAEVLRGFEQGRYNVLCNSMLLCLDEKTEILTNRGFIGVDGIRETDKVANWNMDGTVFFKEPYEIVKRPLLQSENMVSVESKTINFRVTNTHRMIVSAGANGARWKKIAAEDLRSGQLLPAYGLAEPFDVTVKQPRKIEYTGKHVIKTASLLRKRGYGYRESFLEAERRKEKRNRELYYKQPDELSLDECRFIGFFMAEGHIGRPQSGGVEYQFCQVTEKYPEIVRWIKGVVCKIGIGFVEHTRMREGRLVTHWSFPRGTGSGCQQRKGLFPLEPYISKDGTELFWGLNETQFDALIEGFWHGDGHHGNAENGMPRSVMLSGGYPRLFDLLSAIGCVRGWRCHMSAIPQKNERHACQYGLRMIKGRHLNISCKTPIHHEAPAPESVWCVRTESKNIITRRNGYVSVMGNTEGWDCPSVDCIVVLRPTKIRSLYCQMVGRGTRLSPGKQDLLLLDFLWNSERHELCRPACLIARSEEISRAMAEEAEEGAGGAPVDLVEAESAASEDAVERRERALAERLAEMRHRKRSLVDPLQYAMSIAAEDLAGYEPAFGWEMGPASAAQLAALEKAGIFPDGIANAGMASKILDHLQNRRAGGLATPKQIRFLEGRGFQRVGTWQFDGAKELIDRIAGNGWRVPRGVEPGAYRPAERPAPGAYEPWRNGAAV
jgi:superfamily II DNA or RNA helicase